MLLSTHDIKKIIEVDFSKKLNRRIRVRIPEGLLDRCGIYELAARNFDWKQNTNTQELSELMISDSFIGYLLLCNGKPGGYIIGEDEKIRISGVDERHTKYLASWCLDSMLRHTGLARKWMELFKLGVLEQGYERVMLHTINSPAKVEMYESLGFRTVATHKDYYAPGIHAAVMISDL